MATTQVNDSQFNNTFRRDMCDVNCDVRIMTTRTLMNVSRLVFSYSGSASASVQQRFFSVLYAYLKDLGVGIMLNGTGKVLPSSM